MTLLNMINLKNAGTARRILLDKAFTIMLETTHLDERPIYISGSFNNWKARDGVFEMTETDEGKYTFTFPKGAVFNLPFEFKFLKGSWMDVELDNYGSKVSNRTITDFENPAICKVDRWAIKGLSFDPAFYPLIETVSDTFEIPPLGKKRRVRILLPYDYYSSEERYPVMYMQDAQNLFDDRSPYGNWAIDRRLAVLAEQEKGDVIIVAIDHAGKDRVNEFSLQDSKESIGEGKKFARFMADYLKPYIDKNYKTKPEPEFSGLGGSSMGALISVYTGLLYPEVFARKMVLSPSLWAAKKLKLDSINFFNPDNARVFVYAGGKESNAMIPDIETYLTMLRAEAEESDNIAINFSVDPDGVHSERNWSRVFPKAIDWLYFHDKE